MRAGVQEAAFAEQPFGVPPLRLGLVGPDPPPLQQNFSLDSWGRGGQRCRCFHGQKAFEKASHNSVCVCPSHAPSPLFYFALFLLTLLHEGTCISPFSPPCTLAGEDGAVEAPGTLTKSCSEARGWEGCLLQAGGRKG